MHVKGKERETENFSGARAKTSLGPCSRVPWEGVELGLDRWELAGTVGSVLKPSRGRETTREDHREVSSEFFPCIHLDFYV